MICAGVFELTPEQRLRALLSVRAAEAKRNSDERREVLNADHEEVGGRVG